MILIFTQQPALSNPSPINPHPVRPVSEFPCLGLRLKVSALYSAYYPYSAWFKILNELYSSSFFKQKCKKSKFSARTVNRGRFEDATKTKNERGNPCPSQKTPLQPEVGALHGFFPRGSFYSAKKADTLSVVALHYIVGVVI